MWRNVLTLFSPRTEVAVSVVEVESPPPAPSQSVSIVQDDTTTATISIDNSHKAIGSMDDASAVQLVCKAFPSPVCKQNATEPAAPVKLDQLLADITDFIGRGSDAAIRYNARRLIKSLAHEGSIPGAFYDAKLTQLEQKIGDARKIYTSLSELGYGPASFELGRMDEFDGNRDLAISHYTLSIKQDFKDAAVRIKLLQLLEDRGHPEDCDLIASLCLPGRCSRVASCLCRKPTRCLAARKQLLRNR